MQPDCTMYCHQQTCLICFSDSWSSSRALLLLLLCNLFNALEGQLSQVCCWQYMTGIGQLMCIHHVRPCSLHCPCTVTQCMQLQGAATRGLQEFFSRHVSKTPDNAVTAHLDVTPLRVEQDMGVGHQQSRVHEGFHWQLCMQPEPLLYLS